MGLRMNFRGFMTHLNMKTCIYVHFGRRGTTAFTKCTKAFRTQNGWKTPLQEAYKPYLKRTLTGLWILFYTSVLLRWFRSTFLKWDTMSMASSLPKSAHKMPPTARESLCRIRCLSWLVCVLHMLPPGLPTGELWAWEAAQRVLLRTLPQRWHGAGRLPPSVI